VRLSLMPVIDVDFDVDVVIDETSLYIDAADERG
jgi:hypothetical protein